MDNFQKVYYFLKKITENAPTFFKDCDTFKFQEIYLDASENFVLANSTQQKTCIGLIYQHATKLLRNLTHFENEYRHKEDILFYYRSESFRYNFREYSQKYAENADNRRKTTDIYELLHSSSNRVALDGLITVPNKSQECESHAKTKTKYTGAISLVKVTNHLKEKDIVPYGEAYVCLLNKYYTAAVPNYNEDIDVLFQFLDFGAYRLSYRECMSNSKYKVIHYGRANGTFDVQFFGNLKKCINDRMIEINTKKATFLKIDTDWGIQIDNSFA